MAVPMDISLDNSSRELVQRLFNKNAELENKRRKAAQARVPSDPNIWQQMRDNYEAIILEDYAFSEQHEIEYELWQLHYRRIEELRARFNAALAATASQNGKGPPRNGPDSITKIRTQLKTFLSEASGFYHDLMVKIRSKYGLPLGGFSDDPEFQIPSSKDGKKSLEVKKGLVSCHRCLIYLGDLARYKGLYGEGDSKARDFAAASSYYLQASSLWPSSGNPHHQLAILASYSSDELVTFYRYFRSLAVENPFTTARDNLIIAFEKNRQCYSRLAGDAKALSVKPAASSRTTGKGRGKCEVRQPLKDEKIETSLPKEKASPSISGIFKTFRMGFIRLNGILFTRTSLEIFEEVLSMVKNDLLELLSSGSDEKYNFGSDAGDCRLVIVRLVAILIFTIHNVNKGESDNNQSSYAEILQRSLLLRNAFTAVFELMGHLVERCIQLDDASSSFLLPGLLVFVEWLACHHDIAALGNNEPEEKQASAARSFFWKNCIALFNKILSNGSYFVDEDETCFFNMSRYDEGETGNRVAALPEDFELRGFVPLLPAHLILDFSSRKHSLKEKKARLERMISAGKALANNVVRVGEEGTIYFDTRGKKFIIGLEPAKVSVGYQLNNCSVEVTKSNGQLTLGDVQLPKQQVYVEFEEEEDEVIVFKPPSVLEKVNSTSSNTMTSAVVPVSGIVSSANIPSGMGPFSSALEGSSTWSTGVRLPTSMIHTNNTQYMQQPIQPSTSMWSQGAVMNPVLNLMENRLTTEAELLLNHSEMASPAAYSVPLPQSVRFSTANNCSHVQIPDSAAIASSTYSSMKSSSVISKKNPVSRPVRHHRGPPPGFGSVPSSAMTLKYENNSVSHMVDDYSWLDGYQQLPSITHQSINGYSNSNSNHSAQTYHNSGSLVGGMVSSFPFPGKQVPSQQQQQQQQQYQGLGDPFFV